VLAAAKVLLAASRVNLETVNVEFRAKEVEEFGKIVEELESRANGPKGRYGRGRTSASGSGGSHA
jgi:hypothetical protein